MLDEIVKLLPEKHVDEKEDDSIDRKTKCWKIIFNK